MASFPKIARNIPVPSGQNWSLTSVPGSGTQYCLYADDGKYASPTLTANNPFFSSYLKADKFDNNIPTGSGYSVAGFEVLINRYSDGGMFSTSSVTDLVVSLASGDSLIGSNKAVSGLWPLSLGVQTYGAASDDWSTGLGSLLDGGIGFVNSSGFGVIVQVNVAAGGAGQDDGHIDSVSMIVHLNGAVTPTSHSIPLFIHGYDNSSGNIPLSITGHLSSSGNIPLYTYGLASGNSNIPLFLGSANPFSGSLPLYLDGGPHISKCYREVFPSTISTICGTGNTSWVNPDNILVSDNNRATATMTSGDATTCQILSFFNISGISTQAQISGVIFNFYKQQNVGDDSVIDKQVFLIENGVVQSGNNYATGIWGTSDNSPVSYIITQDQNGTPLQINDIMSSGFGVLMQAGTNNFGVGVAQIDTVSCTVCATVPGITSSIPLFLNVSNSSSGNIPLYIEGNTSFSGNIPLFIHGLDTFSGSIPLFINGLLSSSGNIPLYLQSNSFGSGDIPLYTLGSMGQSGGITLYLQGQHTYPANKSLPLYLGNFSSSGSLDSLRQSIPLYLDSHDFNGGITLYLGVSNIGDATNSATLFTKGAAFNSAGSIPLFLNNSGLTHSIPLYVKGLSYGTNPFINTDGYYPFEGGITLYIANNDGANSIPLYIGANFSASGNIPMFLAANPTMTSGIPLYMATSQPMTKSFPLYHHGF